MRDFFPQGQRKLSVIMKCPLSGVDCIFVSKLPFIRIRMCYRREEMRKNVPIKKTIKR